MILKSLLLVSVAVLLAGQSQAENPRRFRAKDSSQMEVQAQTVENQKEYEVRTVNTGFHTVRDDGRWLLLKQRIDSTYSTYADFERGSARVEVSDLGDPGRPLFAVTQPGTGVLVRPPFFAIETLACCGSDSGYAAFSLRTGKLIFFASGDLSPRSLIHINARRSNRHLSVHTSNAANRRDVYDRDTLKNHFLALVSYASDEACLSRVLLKNDCPNPKEGRCYDVRVDHLEWKTAAPLTVDKATGDLLVPSKVEGAAQLRDVALHITFSDKTTVLIPIAQDGLDADHADLPPSTKATLEKCDSIPYGRVR
jgi:hypothetical protein